MRRGLKDLITDYYMELYDYVYMMGHKEDCERFKFSGTLFGYKPLIINLIRFQCLPNFYVLPWI